MIGEKKVIWTLFFSLLFTFSFAFVSASDILYGDVNGDGEIFVDDTVIVSNYLYGGQLIFSDQKTRADVNGDGKVTLDDLTLITARVSGDITPFPVESSSSGSSGNSSSGGGNVKYNYTCVDTDGGINYSKRGVAKTFDGVNDFAFDSAGESCNGNYVIESYCISGESSVKQKEYLCPNGCFDGACLEKSNSCVDTDGGLKIDVYGETIKGDGYYSDYCVERYSGNYDYVSYCEGYNCYVSENYCEENKSVSVEVSCEDRGYDFCNKGACTNEEPFKELNLNSCGSLKNFFDEPYDFEIDGRNWYSKKGWEGGDGHRRLSFDLEDSSRSYIYASLEFYNLSGYYGGDLESFFNDTLTYKLCSRLYAGGQEVYSCISPYQISNKIQDSKWESKTILWASEGLIFELQYDVYDYGYNGCYDEESCERVRNEQFREEVGNFIESYNKLLDNDFSDRIYLNDIDWRIEDLLSSFVGACPSDLEIDSCLGSWECKLEPVLCPPHGVQTRTCVQSSCGYGSEDSVRVQEIQCSPGICSGCYVPRWFDSKLDNTCIPYGFRFEKQTGWDFKEVFEESTDSDSLSVSQAESSGDVTLEVLGNGSAILTLWFDEETNLTIYLVEGMTYDWIKLFESYYDSSLLNSSVSATLFVDEINYNSEDYGESYISVTFTESGTSTQRVPETINAYCDFDGVIKEQKSVPWESCQNNYECLSNVCTSGQCVDVEALADEVRGYKEIGVKVLCRLADIFFIEEYNQCLADRLV